MFYPTPTQREQTPPVGSTIYIAAAPEALHAHTLEMGARQLSVSSVQCKTWQFNWYYWLWGALPNSLLIILGENWLRQNLYHPLFLPKQPNVRIQKWSAFNLTLKMNNNRRLSLTLWFLLLSTIKGEMQTFPENSLSKILCLPILGWDLKGVSCKQFHSFSFRHFLDIWTRSNFIHQFLNSHLQIGNLCENL